MLLAPLTGMDPGVMEKHLEIPPSPQLGDYAFPCYVLARSWKKAPTAIAAELAAAVEPVPFLERAAAAGAYLNFFLCRPYLAANLLPEIVRDGRQFGSSDEGRGRTVVIDYSAPNIAKPFGIGHLRSTVIGNALYRLYGACGYRVVGINHLGDWGTQFGKLIVAYRRFGDAALLEEDPVQYLYDLYVAFHSEAEKDSQLEEEARTWFRKLETGDPEAVELWARFHSLSLKEFKRLYDMLGVHFDSYRGESYYNNLLDKTIELARSKGLARESKGALVADLERHGLPPCLLRKKDGGALYITRDLAAAIHRYEQYRFDRQLYVVGSEQTLHFQQLFKIIELMGFPWAQRCVHVSFGLIHFKDGRMSTREGRVIFLEEVLNRAVELALDIIREKNPTLQDKEKAARMVGHGAVIFGDLVNDRVKDIEFDWDKVLDFSGETAPYVQYSHARICSILRRAAAGESGDALEEDSGVKVIEDIIKKDFKGAGFTGAELLTAPEEQQLIITLSRFQEHISRSVEDCRPSYLARYLVETAREFNKFYHSCPVLSAPEELKRARLLLVEGVRIVLWNGLELLGIEAPSEM